MNSRSLCLLALSVCTAAFLTAQVQAPQAGLVRYPDRSVHAVLGLPRNFIVAAPALTSADALSSSGRFALLAQSGRILLTDANFHTLAKYSSDEPAPVINIERDLSSAVAWLPLHHSLLYWRDNSFAIVRVQGADDLGQVTSVRLTDPDTARLLATNADGSVSEAAIALDSGELTSLDTVPGIRGPAFRQGSYFVFPTGEGLAIATQAAVLRTLPLRAPGLTFERLSADSWHLMSSATGQNWILRLDNPESAHLSELPANPARSAAPAQEARR